MVCYKDTVRPSCWQVLFPPGSCYPVATLRNAFPRLPQLGCSMGAKSKRKPHKVLNYRRPSYTGKAWLLRDRHYRKYKLQKFLTKECHVDLGFSSAETILMSFGNANLQNLSVVHMSREIIQRCLHGNKIGKPNSVFRRFT